MSRYVISLGGSLLDLEGDIESYLRQLTKLILKNVEGGDRFHVVTGGGVTARMYMELANKEESQFILDNIGILSSRLNAYLLISYFKDCSNKEPFVRVDEAGLMGEIYPVVIGGGTEPGHSTDAVASLVAERVRADRFINMTAVDGIYEKDPKKYPDAKFYREITTEELLYITSREGFKAGNHMVIDPLAALIINRSSIPTSVVNGKNLKNLEKLLNGKSYRGTEIVL